MKTEDSIDCKHCQGTGMGSLAFGSNSKCEHCKGKGYVIEIKTTPEDE